jgi:short-subunit dehydrogenase
MATALITGASTGIGRELAGQFASDGHDVILTARSRERLGELANRLRRDHGIRSHVFVMDLADPGAAAALIAEIAKAQLAVDFLVNNAGFGDLSRFAESDPSIVAAMLQLNVVTLTELCRCYLPPMLARGAGRILNVASMAGFQPGPNLAVYYATKAYVLSFSEALHEETRGTGVTVTVLCPGPTDTEFQKRARLADKRLFTLMQVQAASYVARVGYRAMLRGQAIAIPGAVNNLTIQLNRFMPRSWVRRVVKKLQMVK